MGLKKCKSRQPACEEKEEWIYSYGDMVTLLLLFFVIMYSTTDGVSEYKAENIRQSLASAGLIAFRPSVNSKERDLNLEDMDMVDLVLKGGNLEQDEAYATSGSQRLTHIQPDPEEILRRRKAPTEQIQERIESLRTMLEKKFTEIPTSPIKKEDETREKVYDQVETYQLALSRILSPDGSLLPDGKRWLADLARTLRSSGVTDRVDFRIEAGRDSFAKTEIKEQAVRSIHDALQSLFPNSQLSPHAYLIERLGLPSQQRPTRSWLHVELHTVVEQ
jgi:flagellar motor protein MotB